MCSACPFSAKMDKPIVAGIVHYLQFTRMRRLPFFLDKHFAMHHQTTNIRKLDGEDGKVRQIKLSGSLTPMISHPNFT